MIWLLAYVGILFAILSYRPRVYTLDIPYASRALEGRVVKIEDRLPEGRYRVVSVKDGKVGLVRTREVPSMEEGEMMSHRAYPKFYNADDIDLCLMEEELRIQFSRSVYD